MPGTFIVIDGPDGAGTTLHTKLLAERFEQENRSVFLTSEPTSGPIGSELRGILRGEISIPSSALQLLFTADRAWHVEQVVNPMLAQGKTLISDRFTHSTLAYGMALGLDKQWLLDISRKFPRPHHTIFALPPLEVCLERIARREQHDFLEKRETQEKVYAAYRQLAADDPSIVVVDTSGEKEQVAEKIWQIAKD